MFQTFFTRYCSEEEDGFELKIRNVSSNYSRLKLETKRFSSEQFNRVLEKLEIGYGNYFLKLEPIDEQLEQIRAIAEEEEEEELGKEEG